MKEPVIELKDVWKIYQMGNVQVPALRGLNLKVYPHEFVAVIGASGSGKCVSGDTELILDSGLPIKISDIENKKNVKIMALNMKTGKVTPFIVSNFHKRKVKTYLEVTTAAGKKIFVTREHPFFTLGINGIEEIMAKDIKSGRFIATARKIEIEGKSQNLDSLNKMSKDTSLIISNSSGIVKNVFNKLGISKKDICKKFNFNYGTCDSWTYKNNISLSCFKSILEEYGENIDKYEGKLSLRALGSNKDVKIPKITTPELMEIYGLLAGDGNIDKDGLKITNIDSNLKNHSKKLIKKIFDFGCREFIKTRIDYNSKVLVVFFKNIFGFPLNKKSRNIKLPNFVFRCSDKEIASFIRGLFDCDAYVAKNKKEIVITLASGVLIKQLYSLLLRFGIVARYSEKTKCAVGSRNPVKRKYYSLSISGYNNIELYKKNIGFNLKFKKNRLNQHLQGISDTNVDVIPCGFIIRNMRRMSNISFSRKLYNRLRNYETGKNNPSVKKIYEIIELFNENGIDAQILKGLVESDIFWDKVISIKRINKELIVYDLTVPGADSFVANNFIIHNSTAMNMIGSLDVPTKGHVYLDGRDISKMDESHLAQIRGRKIGFIFQQFNLLSNLTALGNVMMPMIFQNVPKWERIKRAKKLLILVGLGSRMTHRPKEMSGGEQQRVAIARALANDPEIILADEPTGNLDSKTGKMIMDVLVRLNKKEKKTVIIITHDVKIANVMERRVRLIDGKITR